MLIPSYAPLGHRPSETAETEPRLRSTELLITVHDNSAATEAWLPTRTRLDQDSTSMSKEESVYYQQEWVWKPMEKDVLSF